MQKTMDDFYITKHLDWKKRNRKRWNEYSRMYKLKNKEKTAEQQHKCYMKHRDERVKNAREYRIKNKERLKLEARERRKKPEVKKHISEFKKKYHMEHREHILKYEIEYRKKNKKELRRKLKAYFNTEKGKIALSRRGARRRKMKFIQIFPNIFPKDIKVQYHHIDGYIFVVPIPKELHQRYPGIKKIEHINNVNNWIEFYYGMHPTDFLCDGVFSNDRSISK